MILFLTLFFFFFFNDTATTEIYTLSLHDALPISTLPILLPSGQRAFDRVGGAGARSEEHTSELQSRPHLVCRLLLEKKKTKLKAVTAVVLAASRETGVGGGLLI